MQHVAFGWSIPEPDGNTLELERMLAELERERTHKRVVLPGTEHSCQFAGNTIPKHHWGNEWGLSVRLTYRQKILPASICLVIDDRLPPMTNCRRLKDEYAVDSHELRKAVSEKTAQWILEILPYA